MQKRLRLLLAFLRRVHAERRLDVDAVGAAVDDEVDFPAALGLHAVRGVRDVDDAHVDLPSAPAQLVVDGVLHQVGRLLLPERKDGVADAGVLGIPLHGVVQVLAAAHVVAKRLPEQHFLRGQTPLI